MKSLGSEVLALAPFARGWSAHFLLGKHPLAQRSTRNHSHRLKVPIALRTPPEYSISVGTGRADLRRHAQLRGRPSLTPGCDPEQRWHGGLTVRRRRARTQRLPEPRREERAHNREQKQEHQDAEDDARREGGVDEG